MHDRSKLKNGEKLTYGASFMGRVESGVKITARVFNWIAAGAMVAMLGLATVDLIAIKVFHWRFAGAFEVVGMLSLLVVVFAISYTQILHGHVAVDFVATLLPKRVQLILDCLIPPVALIVFAPMTWQMYSIGLRFAAQNAASATQKVPFAPLAFATAACAAVMCLVLIVEFVKSVMGAIKWKTTS